MTDLRNYLLITGLLITAVCLAWATPAGAAQVDLRLDVDYAGGIPSAGGTWTLFAETDEQGLNSLIVSLDGINAGVTPELPVGRVNGSATNNAGFANFDAKSLLGYQQVTVGQIPSPQGQQQGLFYGVGTLANGSPDYPGQPSGTNSIGPNITSLTGVQNNPWGNDDPFSSTGVTVLSGSFAPGLAPGFSEVGLLGASLFTTIGSIDTPGLRTLDVAIDTLVTTNLGFGVATGDYNADGRVDAADYTVWRDALNQNVTPLTGADGNGDGTVDLLDRAIWAANYGSSGSATATAVPEPGSATLAALASLALVACRRCGLSRHPAVKTEQSGAIA